MFKVHFRLFEDGFILNGVKPVENREKKTNAEIICKCIERCFGIIAATMILLQLIAYW